MKKALAFLMIAYSAFSHAKSDSETTDSVGVNNPIPEEDYKYSTHLDIAKVIHTDDVSQVCGIVPVKMLYEDSQGKKHLLRYSVMGDGCADN
ncbi:hypothetical protein D3C71_273570 [compost metagenome]